MAVRSLLTAALVATTALSKPTAIKTRAVIDHDAVVGFAEAAPDNSEGDLMLAYKPYLKVFNGCVPFPAVDAEGNTSGGLSPTGDSSAGCSSSTGQVYARASVYEEYFAIMYSWYMPKDEPSDGIGHRHDWENAVVFLSENSSDATFVAMVVSEHGGYVSGTATFDGTHPYVGYISYWPVDHTLIFTTTEGGTQPLIAWEDLTDAAREALDTTDFGDATASFKDSNFQSYLADAYSTAF
ncbi:hypothetical protein N8I77_011221 [Diaporthe amygdali]|uniref:NPP1-domain-containing protein n=1 Tax=Phomopsis amygdali TaxID=1214568 RepID=A0AAD9S7Y6_PHOAM|nr:uncharacterized protein J7T55_004305 [Diaporthe amygdali]KAJ0109756.1 hypothetical protein J7T55_004305 [Diaporthe amygdali]KAK2599468.1 hypothetical protein N8I77_011221 [Diaporthe amygdali]